MLPVNGLALFKDCAPDVTLTKRLRFVLPKYELYNPDLKIGFEDPDDFIKKWGVLFASGILQEWRAWFAKHKLANDSISSLKTRRPANPLKKLLEDMLLLPARQPREVYEARKQ